MMYLSMLSYNERSRELSFTIAEDFHDLDSNEIYSDLDQ